ncbi:MAG: hypothetical protein HYV27_09540 [Candidatus Hydrogenedentes bacterium]|nr:hypothetical protein [Candidatus Hydrogenedentota bacterium]
MSTAFSITPAVYGTCTLLFPSVRRGSAVSFEAQAVTQAARKIANTTESSQALFGEKSAALSQLRELAEECGEDNWDANGAYRIDELAVFHAECFLRAFPEGLPLPEFAPEPDGAISLDWIQSRNRLVSLSVGSGSRIAYAWIDGTDKGHAVARFDGERIPTRILAVIREIVGSN